MCVISSLSDVVSPDSFLMLIITCLFLCLLFFLGLFLASNVSFVFLCALVLRFFFTDLLNSAYFALSFSVFLAFCRNASLFLSKLYISVSSVLFVFVDFCCVILYGIYRFSQNFVHFLYRWFFVFLGVNSVGFFFFLILF